MRSSSVKRLGKRDTQAKVEGHMLKNIYSFDLKEILISCSVYTL